MAESTFDLRKSGDFFRQLSDGAFQDLAANHSPFECAPETTIFVEKDSPASAFIVLKGAVKVSMNTADGKRLILRIARTGDIVGLAALLSGKPNESTAETLYPSVLVPISREDLLRFLEQHPEVYPLVLDEISRSYSQTCEQLRNIGLSTSAPEKLARLLLEWSDGVYPTERGKEFRWSFTHEEIGEFVGLSRETVTRTLAMLKSRRLLEIRGSMLKIPSIAALERYAGY